MHDFSFNAQVQLHFVQGLRTPIQSRVINSGEETLAGVKNAALRAEKSLAPYQTAKDKPAKGVEINEAEVEAVQQGEARSNPFAEYLCHFCKKKGHIQKYCHTRKQQKAQMVPNPYKKGDAKEIDMMSPIYSSPIAANGVLYVASHTHLFAIAETGE